MLNKIRPKKRIINKIKEVELKKSKYLENVRFEASCSRSR